MNVLNFTPSCQCGKVKSKSKQWCESCFKLLTESDKESFTRKANSLRRQISSLDIKIKSTTQLEEGPIDLREPATY